jgi:predicted small secreted protein
MTSKLRTLLAALALPVFLFAATPVLLSGCDNDSEVEELGEEIGEGIEEVGEDIQDAADEVEDEL